MSSPPRIQRDHRGIIHYDEEGDAPDDIVLFPRDDSSGYMSPGLKTSYEDEEDRVSPVEFPMDEYSTTDMSPSRIKGSRTSVAETRTTAQMTNVTEKSEHPRHEDAWDFEMELMTKAKVFRSVLLRPIPVWNDMEEAVLLYAPQWKPSQRSKLIELWIKYMELKVVVEDYATNEEDLMLAPTHLVGRVWYAISQNVHLYQEVIFWIQDYHDKDLRLIYRPPLTLLSKPFELKDDETSSGPEDPKDDDTDIAQFQQGVHHRLERAQRLFICYFQQAMPESLKAVNNMSKRRNSDTVENNIVPENVSEAGDSDFGSDDKDDDDENDDDLEDNKSVYTEFSAVSENWVTRFQSWLSCWDDPFGGNASTAATAQNSQKTKANNVPLDEQLQDADNDLSFWPCAEVKTTKDTDVDNQIKRSNGIGQPNDLADDLPALNETDEGSSTLWVTFDTSKQDIAGEDDDLTFLTMDTALKNKGSPEKAAARRVKKSKFYSPPRRFRDAQQSSPQPEVLYPAGSTTKKSPPYAAQAPKTKNKLPFFTTRKAAPPKATPPKAEAPAKAASAKKKDKAKEKKEYDWKAFKTKFRIASMILKELE
ncbi:MAG: hypothetical protein SGBAC_006645 [Bacillariaceae sp.]